MFTKLRKENKHVLFKIVEPNMQLNGKLNLHRYLPVQELISIQEKFTFVT